MTVICKMTGEEHTLPCPTPSCPLYGDCMAFFESQFYTPMTNADRIRAMSDEELAAMMDAFCEAAECRTADGAVCPFYNTCPHDGDVGIGKMWLNWLQQPCAAVQPSDVALTGES